jgi:solute carrier family 25 carnitine/acylcarnitine transporter 20/29
MEHLNRAIVEYSSFISGCSSGVAQILVGHPFDTIKTYLQSNKQIKTINYVNPLFLYKGFSYPLMMSIMMNSLTFGLYNTINTSIESPFCSGLITGLVLGPFTTPFENLKIHSQMNISKRDLQWLYRGIGLTTLRESLALSIYFSSYEETKKYTNNSFLSGCISGVSNWLITYPIDTIKTRIQNYQYNTIVSAIRGGNLLCGLPVVLIRAGLVNGAIFQTYEITNSYIQDR